MANETGHAKNVANFEDIVSFVTAYGAAYNPSKNSIKLPQLNALLTSARNSLTAVAGALTPFQNATNAREIAVAPLSKLVTRIVSALDSTDASKQTVKDATALLRKIQGRRASAIEEAPTPDPNPTPNPNPEEEEPGNASASQMSFDNRLENFGKLITLLTNEPLYTPNENDLKVAQLTILLTTLKTTNTAVVNTTTALSNARIARNKSLYLPVTGLYDIQAEVKKYVKSVFGARSPEFKQISGIKFTKTR